MTVLQDMAVEKGVEGINHIGGMWFLLRGWMEEGILYKI